MRCKIWELRHCLLYYSIYNIPNKDSEWFLVLSASNRFSILVVCGVSYIIIKYLEKGSSFYAESQMNGLMGCLCFRRFMIWKSFSFLKKNKKNKCEWVDYWDTIYSWIGWMILVSKNKCFHFQFIFSLIFNQGCAGTKFVQIPSASATQRRKYSEIRYRSG